jgi:subtilisin family serine protease
MTRTTILLIAAVTFAAVANAATRYVEGEALVIFKETANANAAKKTLVAHGAVMAKHFRQLSAHRRRPIGLARAKGRTTQELIVVLRRDAAIELVEPNYLRQVSGSPPNDAYFSQLWALQNTGQTVNGAAGTAGDDIRFRDAWSLARPVTGDVVVAVLDTGVDYPHPDLASNMWTNPGEIPLNGLDDDGNGYVDDYYGYDFLNNSSNPFDSGSHGTHVAGTIAATGNNLLGVIGVASNARIMALRGSNDGLNIDSASVIEALDYVTLMKSRGVNIVAVNESFGGGGYSATEIAAIEAAGAAGIVVCVAAGNDSANNDATPTYPASYRRTNMIVVAATDQNDALASFSNYGATTVDLAAPGKNIYSTLPVSDASFTSSVQRASSLYAAAPLEYAGLTTGLTAAIYDCGLGYPTNFPAAVSNNIALIKRGTIFFSEKVANAMAAGALAAIIDNHSSGNFNGTLQAVSNWIPAVAISLEDGTALRATLPGTGTVVNTLSSPAAIYTFKDGTSMATPHVAGAIAFAAVNFPGDNATQRVARVVSSVTAVPALAGKVRTGGRLNLLRLVDSDANVLPDWWEQDYFGHLGVATNADADADGFSNRAEFIAGTNPTNASSFFTATATNGVHVTWPGVPGRTYNVWHTDNLKSSWSILQSNLTGSVWTDTTAAGLTQRFYRIEVLAP